MCAQIKHSFIRGLNRDLADHKQDNQTLYNLDNARILSDESGTGFSIVNIDGNDNLTLDDNSLVRTGFSIIGYTTVRNDIVLFYAEDTATGTNDYTTNCIIDFLRYDEPNDGYVRYELWNDTGLNFRIDKPITAVSRYENELTIKVYWTDNNEPLKYANIAPDAPITEPPTFTRIQGQPAEKFSILQNIDFVIPEFSQYITGNLYAGVIQYAYKLYNIGGNETTYSPGSQMIPLSRYDLSTDTLSMRGQISTGDAIDIETDKGVEIIIDLTGTNYTDYDRIEIVSLHYNQLDVTPTVNILDRIPVEQVVTYRDVGGVPNYGTITYSEFLTQKNEFVCKTLAIKDDILFCGNIQDLSFDLDEELGTYWDSRAYRFTGSQVATLAESTSDNGVSVSVTNPITIDALATPAWKTTDVGSGGALDIPDDENLINTFNNVSYDNLTDTYRGSFQSNGSTIGGEGINISYKFITRFYTIEDDNGTSGTYPAGYQELNATLDYLGTVNENNPWIRGQKRGFQRDEIYRFGIVFYDKKGRSSFVKWIGDIRMPTWYDFRTVREAVNGASPLIPEFTVSNVPQLDGQTLDYRIVYVKRNREDRTVVAQCIGMPIIDGSTLGGTPDATSWYNSHVSYGLGTTSALNGDVRVGLMSPEISYGNTLPIGSNTFLELIGYYDQSRSVAGDNIVSQLYLNGNAAITKYKIADKLSSAQTSVDRYGINHIAKYGYNDEKALGGIFIRNWGYLGDHTSTFSGKIFWGGTKYIAELDSGLGFSKIPSAPATDTSPVFNYKRATIGYGGDTYTARQNNDYIPCADINGAEAHYGDTFIGMFDVTTCIDPTVDITSGSNYKSMQTAYIGLETSINLFLTHSDAVHRVYSTQNDYILHIRETGNNTVYVEPNGDLLPLDWTNLYLYNSVYSEVDRSIIHFPRPIDFESIETSDVRIRYSDTKVNGEEIDSWSIFRANNFNDLDSGFGALNRLEEFKNQIYCWQDTGFSLASINPRVTQVGEDGISTVLGTGTVLDRFNYISTEIGVQGDNDIVKSLHGMYWIDILKKKVYRFSSNGLETLSETKGMSGFFRNVIDKDSKLIGIYDNKHSEVLLTVTNSTDNTMLNISGINSFSFYLNVPLSLGIQDDKFGLIRAGNTIELRDTLGNEGKYEISTIDSFLATCFLVDGTILTSGEDAYVFEYVHDRNTFTVAFSEKLDAFTSFYQFIPTLYIKTNKEYITTEDDKNLYKHNVGNKNTFYGRTNNHVVIEVISNAGAGNVKEFDYVTYISKVGEQVTDGGGYITNETNNLETLYSVYAENDYQKSEEVYMYPQGSFTNMGQDDITNGYGTSSDTRYVLDTNGGNGALGNTILYNTRKVINRWMKDIPRALDDLENISIYAPGSYSVGNIVTYGSDRYMSMIDNNTNSPAPTNQTDKYVGNTLVWKYVPFNNKMRDGYVRLRFKYKTDDSIDKEFKLYDLDVHYTDILN